MELKFIHFYPDLMNLYGSYANVSALKRLLEGLGHAVTVEAVAPVGEADVANADFVFMGAGTERRQKFALADFLRFKDEIKAAAEAGTPMLFAGTAMELLGATITDSAGKVYEGLGLAGFSSVQGARRITEDVYGHTGLYPDAVVGFMNKCTAVTGVETPLLTGLDMGWGNDGEKSPEGFLYKNVVGSELTGPLLVKNPRLLDWVASAVLARRGEALPEERSGDWWAMEGWQVTERELRRRWES